jgi:hypothetical protein
MHNPPSDSFAFAKIPEAKAHARFLQKGTPRQSQDWYMYREIGTVVVGLDRDNIGVLAVGLVLLVTKRCCGELCEKRTQQRFKPTSVGTTNIND